jgi:hypothetical protein
MTDYKTKTEREAAANERGTQEMARVKDAYENPAPWKDPFPRSFPTELISGQSEEEKNQRRL